MVIAFLWFIAYFRKLKPALLHSKFNYPMLTLDHFSIKNNNNELINISFFINHTFNTPQPLLIFAHGFKGFKDWGGFPYMCEKLSENGFTVLSFNFSHNGVEESAPMDFTRLDLFAENTHSIELNDLDAVIKFIPHLEEKHPGKLDIKKVGLIGHSRGGGLSVITAAEHPEIKALVTLAAVADFNRYTVEQKKRWREKGYIEMPNMRTNQLMKMNVTLLDDIEKNSERLSIVNAAGRLNIPWLIIHGKEDLSVKFTDAEKLFAASNRDKTELKIINNTGHTFGVEHPFKGTTNAFEEVINTTSDFFKNNL